MKEYKGFKYEKLDEGRWTVVFPSKFKTTMKAKTEENLQKKIDIIIEDFAN